MVILTDIVDTEELPGVDLCSKNSFVSFKVSCYVCLMVFFSFLTTCMHINN